MTILSNPTWLIGCGNMGTAIVDGWRAAGVDLSQAVVIRPSGREVPGVRTVKTMAEAGAPPKMVLLAVKPQKLDEIAPTLKPWLTSRTVLVSILAGAEAGALRARFDKPAAIVRAMPNLPVAVRRGVIALYSEDADEPTRKQVGALFSALGFALWASAESQFAAIGALGGAGPAYVDRFVNALAAAGEALGMNQEIAAMVALETVFGTAWLAASGDVPAGKIAGKVASPNGTTEAGLAVLDRDDALRKLVGEAISAASRRGAELADEARR